MAHVLDLRARADNHIPSMKADSWTPSRGAALSRAGPRPGPLWQRRNTESNPQLSPPSKGRAPVGQAVQKGAHSALGVLGGQRHGFGFRLVHHGRPVLPVDVVGVEPQLVWFSKSSNTAILAAAHHHQLLPLNGCFHDTKIWAFTPLGNDSRLTVTSVIFLQQVRPGTGLPSASSPNRPRITDTSCGAKDQRMFSSRRIFPGSTGANRWLGFCPARPGAASSFEARDGGVVPQEVAHHQDALFSRARATRARAVLPSRRAVFPQRRPCSPPARAAPPLRVPPAYTATAVTAGSANTRRARPRRPPRGTTVRISPAVPRRFGHGAQGAQRVEVAHQVPAPIAAPDHGH